MCCGFSKSKNCEYVFPNKGGTGFNNLLPHVTEMGKELLKLMLVYDPESRCNVKKLLEHRYLNIFKQNSNLRQSSSIILSSLSQDSCQWRNNPVLLSYITSEKRRICKVMSFRLIMMKNLLVYLYLLQYFSLRVYTDRNVWIIHQLKYQELLLQVQ